MKARPVVDTPWMTFSEAVAYSRRGRRAVLAALQAGELVGLQVTQRGAWTIHRDAVDAWNRGEVAEVHPQTITRRRAS